MSTANDMAVEYLKGLVGHVRKGNTAKLRQPKPAESAPLVEGADEEESAESELEALLEGDDIAPDALKR